ncbi:MAG: hypothetical protein HYY58_03220 [Candidatus Omnitrophica bacterium]|nr:hypothetical protein [Candidatus Omnitrophota bacterium]
MTPPPVAAGNLTPPPAWFVTGEPQVALSSRSPSASPQVVGAPGGGVPSPACQGGAVAGAYVDVREILTTGKFSMGATADLPRRLDQHRRGR